ncbi:hypothetical protein LshimejAT787_0601550 [Lyophyllum shimeji]|uniref:F-box domain-containing protein n=1 Tax=Lyophyllum shimeji TaxID=47721 RepID=A0A9P3UMU2_LYOSH|nr:hypothetical protein LshimejAT787_0601550 [Lyophyllum shimeji]
MSTTMQSSSCKCLNVRFFYVGDKLSEVVVTHPRLIDFVLRVGEDPHIHFACLLCGSLLFDCRWSLNVTYRRASLEFGHAAFESVTMLSNRIDLRYTGGVQVTDAQRLAAINSPAFSSTFSVLTRYNVLNQPPDGLLLDAYPEHLSQVMADLCDVLFKRSLRLRAAVLSGVETHVDIADEERKMRSEFVILCRLLWDAHHKDFLPDHRKLFMDTIGPYLTRINASFRESCIANGIPNAPATVGSDPVAMSAEELSFDGVSIVQVQEPLKPTTDRGPTFTSLPTETVWKIFDFLRPRYCPIDMLSAKKYLVERSSFAQLMLVSKVWRKWSSQYSTTQSSFLPAPIPLTNFALHYDLAALTFGRSSLMTWA